MPFGPVGMAIVGQESKFCVAGFFATRQDIAAILGRDVRFVSGAGIYGVAELAAGSGVIARRGAEKGKTDGIEYRGFSASRRPDNRKYVATAHGTVFKIYDLALGIIERSKIQQFQFQESHGRPLIVLLQHYFVDEPPKQVAAFVWQG